MTVTIIRPASTDRDDSGDLVVTDPPTSPTRIDVTDCQIGPRADASNEIHKHGRNGVVEELSLYRRPPFEFLHTDKVEVGDKVYDVEGHPATWGESGVVVNLRRTVG